MVWWVPSLLSNGRHTAKAGRCFQMKSNITSSFWRLAQAPSQEHTAIVTYLLQSVFAIGKFRHTSGQVRLIYANNDSIWPPIWQVTADFIWGCWHLWSKGRQVIHLILAITDWIRKMNGQEASYQPSSSPCTGNRDPSTLQRPARADAGHCHWLNLRPESFVWVAQHSPNHDIIYEPYIFFLRSHYFPPWSSSTASYQAPSPNKYLGITVRSFYWLTRAMPTNSSFFSCLPSWGVVAHWSTVWNPETLLEAPGSNFMADGVPGEWENL